MIEPTSALAAAGLLGVVGVVGGITAGDQAAKALTGKGVRKGRFEKGSQEAKDYMASIRAKRGQK